MATGEIMIPVKSIAVLLAKRAVVRAPLRSVFRVSRTKTVTPRLFLPGFVLLGTLASSSQVTSPTDEIKSPDLNLILQRLEDTQHQEPAQARPYEVTREYKVLRGYNTQPTSEVVAQINFVPPDTKTYKIIQTKGESRGERMVRELLAPHPRDFEVGSGSFERLFKLGSSLSGVWCFVLKMFDFRLFAFDSDFHFSEIRASVI
jgi:hypothetical protein